MDYQVLAVDLDGTLLRSDMLGETFWSAVSTDWKMALRAFAALRQGRAHLKSELSLNSAVDVSVLPFNAEVIDYVKSARAAGVKTALVTATNQQLAQAIADHLGIFDEVHGSTETVNLKSGKKSAHLDATFGAGTYAYMGDARADLKVWETSAKSITLNAPKRLRTAVEQQGNPVEHLTAAPAKPRAYLKAMRPHQWVKNTLVFLPMLTAHQLSLSTFLLAVLAFISFSLVASSVYILNDLLDLSADRAHKRKRFRPFAAGDIPILHGFWLAPGLFLAGFAIALFLGAQFVLIMLAYYVITTAYSLYLKRKLVVDVATLGGLYTMRIVAGGAACMIPISVWLLAFSIFFFFSLAAVKRQAELVDLRDSNKDQPIGRGYHTDDLMIVTMMAIASGYVSVLVMALYLNSPTVQQLYTTPGPLWGICLVLLYWLSRMPMITHRGRMHDDPIVFAAKDGVSRACGVIIFAFGLYGALA